MRFNPESAACAPPPASFGRPAFRGPPFGRGRGVAGARWLLGPRAPCGAAFRPAAAASGDYGSGNVVGCASVSISARFARFGGRYAPPHALNYVKSLLAVSRLFLAHFGLFLPRYLLQFFAQAPLPLRPGSRSPTCQLPVNSRFGTYRKKTYLCPQLAVPASGYPCRLRIHEVVYRP